jgi:hypothetical protein
MRFVIGGALVVVAVVSHVKIVSFFSRMMMEVNAALPSSDQTSEWGFSWLRARVIREHRQLFPNSALRKKLYAAYCVEFGTFTTAIAFLVRFKH